MSGAPKLELSVQKSIESEAAQLHGSTVVTLDSLGMKPPTRKYQYIVAQNQPNATGYFTITNYT
jgi:hypothetical protein